MNKQTKFIFDNVVNDPKVFSILNIGYRDESDPTLMINTLGEGKTWTVLEVFHENCETMKKHGMDVIEMDVRDIKNIDRKFDAIIWLHGPEHIMWEEFLECRTDIENKANHLVVYQAPIGVYPQDALYDNPYEKHVSTLYSSMFSDLGYKTEEYGIDEPTFSAWIYT